MRGFFGIGIYHPKSSDNFGTLFRTAQVLNASFVYLIGARFKKQASDTMKSWRHVPVYEYVSFEQFKQNLPYDCQLVGIEMCEEALMLDEFSHPERAAYLLGAEDNGLPKSIMDQAHHLVKLPGERSLNVSVAGSIVAHDRIAKGRTNR